MFSKNISKGIYSNTDILFPLCLKFLATWPLSRNSLNFLATWPLSRNSLKIYGHLAFVKKQIYYKLQATPLCVNEATIKKKLSTTWPLSLVIDISLYFLCSIFWITLLFHSLNAFHFRTSNPHNSNSYL